MSMSSGQEQGGSAVHRILPPTFYQTTLCKSRTCETSSSKKCEKREHSIKRANIIKKKAYTVKRKANIFIERPTYVFQQNKQMSYIVTHLQCMIQLYHMERKINYFILFYFICITNIQEYNSHSPLLKQILQEKSLYYF